jgi:hypothetical protein
MTVLYPGLDSPEFAASFATMLDRIAALGRLFDDERIAGGASAPLTDEVAVRFERVLAELNATVDDYETMNAYLYSFVTTDSRNDTAQARVSELQRSAVALTKAFVRWDAWIGTLDIDSLIDGSPAAAAHAFSLRRSQEQARHQMSPAEEALAAELRVPGGIAWAKLYDNVTSQIHGRARAGGRGPSPADEQDPELCLLPRPGVCGRVPTGGAGRLGGLGNPAGGGVERDQGRGQHAASPPRLGRPARRSGLQRQHRP